MNLNSRGKEATAEWWLKQLADLERELEIATDAIARNSLAEFEQSLWRQEMLCSGLKRSMQSLRRAGLDSQPLKALRASARSVWTANRSYAVLIARTRQSAAVLQDLCGLYRHLPSRRLSLEPTLSCEA